MELNLCGMKYHIFVRLKQAPATVSNRSTPPAMTLQDRLFPSRCLYPLPVALEG